MHFVKDQIIPVIYFDTVIVGYTRTITGIIKKPIFIQNYALHPMFKGGGMWTCFIVQAYSSARHDTHMQAKKLH